MDDIFLNKYIESLQAIASQLSGSLCLPINIFDVCLVLNITLNIKESPTVSAEGVSTDDGFSITIKRTKDKISLPIGPFERFLVGHEIGHYILNNKLGVIPYDKHDYWKLEALCDFFSRVLLIPEYFIKKELCRCEFNPKQIYSLSDHIAKKAMTNWQSCAHRISDLYKSIIFLELKRQKTKEEKYFIVTMSTLEGKAAQHSKISHNKVEERDIYNFIESIIDCTGQESSIVKQCLSWRDMFNKFKIYNDFNDCSIIGVGSNTIRIVAVTTRSVRVAEPPKPKIRNERKIKPSKDHPWSKSKSYNI